MFSASTCSDTLVTKRTSDMHNTDEDGVLTHIHEHSSGANVFQIIR
jgi:hypothetical protein